MVCPYYYAAGPGRKSRAGAGATAAGKAAVRKAVGSKPAPAGSKPGAAKNKKVVQGRKSKSALTKKLAAKKG